MMPVSCQLRILLARLNLERARAGQPAISLRRLARESGVSLSTVMALNAGQSQRVDFATIDRLLAYFSRSLDVAIDDLFTWHAPAESSVAAA
jgi:DNA-binding Xre family transcriptional regulator